MYNSFTCQGRMVDDPRVAETNGIKRVTFTIACDRDLKQEDGKNVDFFDFIAWRDDAEYIARRYMKGDLVLVTARAKNLDWVDKNGNKKHKTEFHIGKERYSGKIYRLSGNRYRVKEQEAENFAEEDA